MLTIQSRRSSSLCDGVSRREFLRVGGLCVGGLTQGDLLRLQAAGAARKSSKAVIMIFLQGGPSHIDTYDMKPNAPAEFRGEYQTIRTNVPGFDICERLPLQARIADRLAVVRNLQFTQDAHDGPHELETGSDKKMNRPGFGSIVSRLERDAGRREPLPPYVALHNHAWPSFLGAAHKPFVPGDDLKSLAMASGVTLDKLSDRKSLLAGFDTLNRNIEAGRGEFAGIDTFTEQAFAMISSPRARDAFDVAREAESVRRKYGEHTQLLQARRLVEAGVKVVSLTFIGVEKGRKEACGFGGGTWDTHGNNFKCLDHLLPQLDQAVYALVTDLHERGLDQDVAVVVWGEFGRGPKLTPNPGRLPGREHWPQAGFALLAGGGLQTGQVVGATDSRAAHPLGRPYTPQNVLATLYHCLGIDPATTLPDHQGRPQYLLDDRRLIEELV